MKTQIAFGATNNAVSEAKAGYNMPAHACTEFVVDLAAITVDLADLVYRAAVVGERACNCLYTLT